MTDLINILIIKLSSIGDVVHSLPFLEVIKQCHPDSKIDWLIEEEASQVITGHPAINRIIVSGRKRWQKDIFNPSKLIKTASDATRFYKDLRSYSYDIVIDLQGLFKSGILAAISKGKRKVGMSGSREGASFFLKEPPVSVSYEQHAIERYLKVASYLGCNTEHVKGNIPVSEQDKISINSILGPQIENKNIIAVNPMSKWKTKLWEEDKFSRLASMLQKNLPCYIIFTGSKHDVPIIDGIINKMDSKEGIINLAGKTSLKELSYLYSKCSVLVCTDTGPMHIAAAMECKVVALFGPTDPLRTGPYGNGHKVIRSGMDCSPCLKRECESTSCMKNITVEEVFDVVRSLL